MILSFSSRAEPLVFLVDPIVFYLLGISPHLSFFSFGTECYRLPLDCYAVRVGELRDEFASHLQTDPGDLHFCHSSDGRLEVASGADKLLAAADVVNGSLLYLSVVSPDGSVPETRLHTEEGGRVYSRVTRTWLPLVKTSIAQGGALDNSAVEGADSVSRFHALAAAEGVGGSDRVESGAVRWSSTASIRDHRASKSSSHEVTQLLARPQAATLLRLAPALPTMLHRLGFHDLVGSVLSSPRCLLLLMRTHTPPHSVNVAVPPLCHYTVILL